MIWWTKLWQFLTEPTGGTLGRAAWLLVGISMLVAIAGAILALRPHVITRPFVARTIWHAGPVSRRRGPSEARLDADLRVKLGIGASVWSLTLVLALLLRLVGTPELTARLLPALVLVMLPVLVGYAAAYRLFFYPSVLEQCRSLDTRRAYEPTAKRPAGQSRRHGGARAGVRALKQPKIGLLPVKATLATIGAVLICVLFMILFPGAAHLFGMLVVAPLGYALGLTVSLGDGWRDRSFRPSVGQG